MDVTVGLFDWTSLLLFDYSPLWSTEYRFGPVSSVSCPFSSLEHSSADCWIFEGLLDKGSEGEGEGYEIMGLLFVDCSLWGRTHVMIYNFIVPVSWFNLSNSIILEQFLDLTGIDP